MPQEKIKVHTRFNKIQQNTTRQNDKQITPKLRMLRIS